MDIYRDPLGKLDRDKALVFRERQEAQLTFLRDKLIKLKNRRQRIMRKLDTEISKCEEDINDTKSVIEAVDNMLGVRVESALARSIKRDVTKEEEVQGAYDLVLNDYGPDKYLGSIHIEVADTLTVADIDKISRRITKKILEKYGVILHTIGVYSVNTKDKFVMDARKEITKIVFSHEGILQMHGFYIDQIEKNISFDIIIDFKIDNREEVYKQIYDEVQNKYKDYSIDITLDVDISD